MTDRKRKQIEKEINELQNDNFYRIVLKDKEKFDENVERIIELKKQLRS